MGSENGQSSAPLEPLIGPTIGQTIVDAIIAGQLVHAECASNKEHGCLMVWSANVYEQIDTIVAQRTRRRGNRIFDAVHDVVIGYGWLILPLPRGQWLMWSSDRRRFGRTRWGGFHNCSATGTRG